MKIALSFIVATFMWLSVFSQTNQLPQLNSTQNKTKYQPANTRSVWDTIWYNDFSNPGDWSMSYTGGTGDWEIQTTQNPNAGNGTGTIQNSTWQDGFAIYDANLYGISMGEDAYIEYTGTIDCSAYSNVGIKFEQLGRKSDSTRMYVDVSNNGSTWDSYEVNQYWNSGLINSNPININISATAGGQSTVYLRFHYHGINDYCLNFDDIALVEGANYDMVVLDYIPQFLDASGNPCGWYSEIPKNMVMPLGFIQVPVYNNGIDSLTVINLHTMISENSMSVYDQTTYTSVYSSVLQSNGVDTLFNNIPFYPDSLTTHAYTLDLDVGMNETDQDTSSNIMNPSRSFYITNGVLRRSSGHDLWIDSTVLSAFYLPQVDTLFFADFYIYADQNAYNYGGSYDVSLYMADSASGDWLGVMYSDVVDLIPQDTAVGGCHHYVQFMLDGFTEILQPGLYAYGVTMYYDTSTSFMAVGAANQPNYFPVDTFIGPNVYWNWNYVNNVTPNIGLHFDSLQQFDTLPQVVVDTCILFNYNSVYIDSYVWIDPSHIEVTWAFAGSGQISYITATYQVTTSGNYVLPLTINCGTKSLLIFYDNLYVDEYVGQNSLSSETDFKTLIYPNPANDNLTISITYEQLRITDITVLDIMGKQIKRIKTKGQSETCAVDVSGLPSGVYFIEIQTDKGSVVKKFIKQ